MAQDDGGKCSPRPKPLHVCWPRRTGYKSMLHGGEHPVPTVER